MLSGKIEGDIAQNLISVNHGKIPPSALKAYSPCGKVCLGVGYRSDNAEVALASAVLLAGAGQTGYAEMVSHHMREGFGTTAASAQQSGAWMKMATDSLAAGGTAVLGQSSDRVAVLNAAMQGGNSPSSNAAAALPVFPAPSNN